MKRYKPWCVNRGASPIILLDHPAFKKAPYIGKSLC